MRLFVITIYDRAAESYHAPLFFPAIGMAERFFRDECNSGKPDSAISAHPEDYSLYLLGAYETTSAELITEVPPRLLIQGSAAVRTQQ